jgi:hypothetical protein
MAMRVLLVTVSLLLLSCASSPTDPLESLSITTDRTSYALGDQINLEIRNNTESDAFFEHCGHRLFHVIQRQVDGNWLDRGGWGPGCPTIYISGVEVLIPGTARLMTIASDQRGTFRIVFETASRSKAIGAVTVASNVFQIE